MLLFDIFKIINYLQAIKTMGTRRRRRQQQYKQEEELSFAFIDFGCYESEPIFDTGEHHLEVWINALNVNNSKWIRYKGSEGEFPSDEELYDLKGIVIPASRYSANNDWIEAYAFIRKVVERGMPQLYCAAFGSHLLAVALGGTMGSVPSGKFKFGSEDIKILPDWYKHPILGSAKSDSDKDLKNVTILKAHGHCVTELPENAVLAASSETCENEVWYIGNNILAMQCHPEFTAQLMRDKMLPKFAEKGLLSADEVEESAESFKKVLDNNLLCNLIRQFLCYESV